MPPPRPDRDVDGNFESAHERRREVVWTSQNMYTLAVHSAILEAIRSGVDTREFNFYPDGAGGREPTFTKSIRVGVLGRNAHGIRRYVQSHSEG